MVMGIEEAYFSMSVHPFDCVVWMNEQLDQGACGDSKKQHGGVGVDSFTEFFRAACVSGAA